MRRAWLAAAVIAVPLAAHANPITVKVIEIAGDVAYVTPGKQAGLTAGTKVTFGSAQHVIFEVTESTAAFKLDGLVVVIGQTGVADATGASGNAATTSKALRAEPEVSGVWPTAAKPAGTQEVKAVPLGGARRSGDVHVTAISSGYAVAGKGASFADGEERVIASWDILSDHPFAADVDVAGRAYTERYSSQLRVPFFVRVAELRYGNAIDPMFALGRLRYAASSVGMLDGARGAFHVGDLELAAFGGIVPDPVNGKPDTSATRFGASGIYDIVENPWRPRVEVTATGSTWTGQLDERRLSVDANANKGAWSMDAWAEGQEFAKNNPWNAPTVQLTGAGANAEWRDSGSHAGVDLDFLRPERSLRLAAALPSAWLCTQNPLPGNVAETCSGSDYWNTATASAGTRFGRFSVDAYGTVGYSHLMETSLDASLYVRGEVQILQERFVFGGTVGQADFGAWDSGEAGIGTVRWRPLDLLVRYRFDLLDYVASTGVIREHTLAADVRYPYSRSLDVGLSAVGTTGSDRTLLAVLTTIVWRPLR
jgi:hypothetical protein